MEGSFNQSGVLIPRDEIRFIESDLKAQLDNSEVDVSDTIFQETSRACDRVRERVLNYEDEPHLSKNQNNCRRISIASELLIQICSVYWDVVDYEFSKSIHDIVQWERYKKISNGITQKIQSETKTEKLFAKEALTKLKEAERKEVTRDSPQLENGDREENGDLEREFATGFERETPTAGERTVDASEIGVPHSEIIGISENELSNILENLTALRDEPVTDTSRQQFPISNISRQDLQVPDTIIESSIQGPETQEKLDESLREILEILEERIPEGGLGAIEQPETLLDSRDNLVDVAAVEERPPDNGKEAVPTKEGSENWSLPSLESVEATRRRQRHLIIDQEIVIHQYAERAVRLNRSINIQRVQIFEGPPDIVQASTASHLMKTPAYKSSSLFRDLRSSKLSTLYNRHLKTETRSFEPILFERRAADEQRIELSKAGIIQEVVEDVGVKVGMHSAAERTVILAEVPPKRSRMEDLEMTFAIPPNETTLGMPVSRMINPTIPPLEDSQLERINKAPHSPRVQEIQGRSIDPKTTPPWFLSTKANSPNAKFREFNYVYTNIQKYWLAFEGKEMEKCITLKEFLSLESDESIPNFLTVLRIVDKLSIQRKLKLQYKGGDVFIYPFEGSAV